MAGVETESLMATCGDPQTGSSKVTATGLGVSRVGIDTAVGVILGPGSPKVFVEGFSVSMPGDIIMVHPPCPLPAIHCAALTNPGGNSRVFAGTGFTGGGSDEDGNGGSSHTSTVPNLVVESFSFSPEDLIAPYPLTVGVGPVEFEYSIKNDAQAPAGAFTVGLWQLPPTVEDGGPFLLTREAAFWLGAILIDSAYIPELGPGAVSSGTFEQLADPLRWDSLLPPTYYAVFADIDSTVSESDETNWTEAFPLNVTQSAAPP